MSEVMSDPVMAADGHAHERSAIERWLATHQVDEPADGRRARAQHPGPRPHAAPSDPGLRGGAQGSVTMHSPAPAPTLEFHRVLVGVSLPPVICDL